MYRQTTLLDYKFPQILFKKRTASVKKCKQTTLLGWTQHQVPQDAQNCPKTEKKGESKCQVL